jgi:hypothetical protein
MENVHNEELHSLHRSPSIINSMAHGIRRFNAAFTRVKYRRVRWAGYVAGMEEDNSTFKNLVLTKIVGNRILRRPRRRWEDNI